MSFWRGEYDEIDVAKTAPAENFCSVRRPSWICEFADRIGKLAHSAAVAIHNTNLKSIVDAPGKNKALTLVDQAGQPSSFDSPETLRSSEPFAFITKI